MIYFSGIAAQRFNEWEIPDDNPRFATVEDSYRLFLGIHFRMLRAGDNPLEPYYRHYLACVEHYEARMRLSQREFRNAVGVIVDMYRRYFEETEAKRREALLDSIGKFERLVYLFSNKTHSERAAVSF